MVLASPVEFGESHWTSKGLKLPSQYVERYPLANLIDPNLDIATDVNNKAFIVFEEIIPCGEYIDGIRPVVPPSLYGGSIKKPSEKKSPRRRAKATNDPEQDLGSEEEIDFEDADEQEADDETFPRAKSQSQNGRGRQTSKSKEFGKTNI